MSEYDKATNTRKVKRYRLRKRLKEEGYSEEEIAQELALLDEELGWESESEYTPRARSSRAPGQESEPAEYEGESGGSWVWWALGIAGALLFGIIKAANQGRREGPGEQKGA